jgi:predicted RNA-binding Zn-ribbon protein involved in translation (DUF1610 family)
VSSALHAHCPFCEHDQAVPAEVLASLRRYQADAARLNSRITSEQRQRAQWTFWYGQDGKARHAWVFPIVLLLGIGTVIAVCLALLEAHVIEERDLSGVLTPGIIGTYLVGLALYGIMAARRKARAATSHARAAAQCPLCGGVLPFEFGAVSRTCPHCGGAVVTDDRVANQLLGAVEYELQKTRMSRYRLERNAMSRVYRSSASRIVPYIVIGSFLPGTLGVALIFTFQFLLGTAADISLGVLLLIWLLALGHVGSLYGIHRFRRYRRNRYQAMTEGVTSILMGHLSTQSSHWVGWLNTFWAGEYPVGKLFVGPYFHCVTGNHQGYPIALDIDPVPADAEHCKPRADVLLAACTHVEEDHVPIANDLHERARTLGFSLHGNTGGFRAEGCQLAALFGAPPSSSANILLAAANLLADCAQRTQSPPARAIPE